MFTRETASVTCTAATRGGQRASDGRTPAAAQPRALAPVAQSGVQPPLYNHRRTARDAPASKRLAPWVPHHIWKRARLTHTARGAPGSRTARGPAHGVPRIGLARVQTAFSTRRTSEVPADLRMGES